MKLYAAITKRDDEQRMVWGYASTEALDSQGEVVKLDAIKGAWDDYMRFANIREMHQPSAVGKCKEYDFDEHGVQIGVKVVDDAAWEKVKEGVYSGFSIGGKALSKADNIITALRLTEISLVDRPANPEALISVWKGEEADPVAAEHIAALAKYAGEQIMDSRTALEALAAIAYLLDKESNETGEPPEQVAALRAAVEALKTFVASEVMEPDHKVDDPDGLAKSGARYSKATKQQLADLHAMVKACDEHLGKMGYMEAEEDGEEETGKAETEIDVAKLADLEAKVAGQDAALAEIAKALGMADGDKYLDAITKMADRIKELEALPAPPKGAARVIDKAGDGCPDAAEDIEKQLESIPAEQLPSAIMKLIHRSGAHRIV